MGTWGTQHREMSAEVRATWGCGRCEGHKIPSRGGGRLCLQRGRRVGTHSQLQGKGDGQDTLGREDNCEEERDLGEDLEEALNGSL